MKNLIYAIAILSSLLIASVASAAYFSCDPQAGVEVYRFDILKIDDVPQTGMTETSNAGPNGEMGHDIDSWQTGKLEGNARAGKEYVLNNEPQGVYIWSDPTPFVLESPEKFGEPQNMIITATAPF